MVCEQVCVDLLLSVTDLHHIRMRSRHLRRAQIRQKQGQIGSLIFLMNMITPSEG